MNKKNWWTILIIIGVILLVIVVKQIKKPEISEELAKCIGDNSQLYVQKGCSHCEKQEELFGSNIKYISVVDCFYELDKCSEITNTPTWIIKGEKYIGFQSAEELKQLTGC